MIRFATLALGSIALKTVPLTGTRYTLPQQYKVFCQKCTGTSILRAQRDVPAAVEGARVRGAVRDIPM